jgi:tetratricopeptide (TPR) repeat protein
MPEAHRHSARCLAGVHQDEFARSEYRLAAMLGDPSALPEAVGRWNGAQDLRQLVPDTAEGVTRLATLLEALDRHAEAAAVLESAWNDLSDPDLLFQLGQVQSRLGDQDGALDAATALRDTSPDDARSWVLASLALARFGDDEGAIRELEEGRARLPRSADLTIALGAELIRQRKFAQGIQLLTRAEWRTPRDAARARDVVISALRAQGRLTEAIAEARVAHELDPRNAGAAIRLADLLAEAGSQDEAILVLSLAAGEVVDRAAVSARMAKLRAAHDRRGVTNAPTTAP